ncbi:MAG: tyrosine-type recombinase/integrase [Candidatus Omnitrophica bacterium]|nr:tyrosine-type recombinase/integrase [Candidatus Omnitrophota bacterium]
MKLFEEYKIWLKETNHKDNTVNNHVKVLKTIFNQAVKWEILEKNPVRHVGNIGVEDEKPIVCLDTPEKFELFFSRCKVMKPEYFNQYYCAAKLGLRWKEVVFLEWDDIDFENRVILIRKKKNFTPKGRTRKDRKPKTRVIAMPADVVEILRGLERKQARVFLKDDKPMDPKDKTFRNWIIAIVRGTQLEGMSRMHELRHTTGHILGLTHSLHEIKEFLGHTDIRTTERYVRVGDEAKRSMARALERFGNVC